MDSRRFADGSITKIVYHNFLTYDDVECKPGPNLNVFIGTNGAGKSTVICGICLAVGGSPKVLGRSERMGDYIKHKKDEGFVELYIADSRNGEQRVKILLQRPNKCTYFINGSKVTQREVRDLVASYNIQVDNPCTFLAQDKVKSFSEQSPVDLLMNTERAGDPHLLKKHEELIKKKKDEAIYTENAREIKQRLLDVDRELTVLLPRAENYKKKEFLRTKIGILEKKKAILDFRECSMRYAAVDETVKELRIAVEYIKKQIENIRKESAGKLKKKSEYEENHVDALRQIREISREINSLKNKNMYSEMICDATNRFQSLKLKNDNWEQELSQIRSQVELLRENIAEAKEKMDGYEEFKKEASRKTHKCNEIIDSLCRTEVELSSEEKKLFAEKNSLQNEERRVKQAMEGRLRILENLRCNMADEAWRWYEGNREKFRYPIYVPILHMTVPDGRSAMLLENLIAVRDLPMFIFGCKEDEALLTDRRHSWKLNSTVMPTSQIDVSSLKTTLTQEMKELGFTHFAIDLFESVDVIKQYLCNVAKLHQVPIGSSKTNDLYDTIKTLFSRNSYKLYLTDRYRVQFTVSKYGSREILGQQSELKSPARLFVAHSTSLDERHKVHADMERVRNWEADLRSRRMELNQAREQIQREKELLREQQAEWKTRREALMNFERSLSNRERKLEDVITNRPDFDQAMAALVETKINASKEVYKVTLKLLCKLEELRVMRVKETFIKVILNQLSNKEKEFEKELFSLEEKLQNNMSLMESQFEMFRGIKEEFTRVQECLHDKCGLKTLDAEKMIREEKKVLEILEKLFIEENIPDSILDVVRLLEEEKVKLDIATVDGSKEDVDRCERLKQEKATLLGRKDQQEAVKEAWMAELMNEITEWRNTVEQLIRSISSNYSNFFAQIGCAGEVYLDVPEDLSDISEYGIMVMVSFRSGERLRRLDHQVQSGGERSVSTMLYLLALQELCLVPFRCVDEINQGMDPTNERKVFDIIVNALSGDGNLAKTQYFLLTPKLLHGLKFNRNVTVQIVHNGATLSKNCHNWDVDNFLAIMKSRYGH